MKQPPKKDISERSQIRYACHVVRLLLPWLRKLRQEQMEEKKLEAKIKGIVFWCLLIQSGHSKAQFMLIFFSFYFSPFAGVSVNELKLEQADCNLDERAYWFGLSSFPFCHNLIAASI